eukprot:3054928-Alexandrium_andersonii.AAC.1
MFPPPSPVTPRRNVHDSCHPRTSQTRDQICLDRGSHGDTETKTWRPRDTESQRQTRAGTE